MVLNPVILALPVLTPFRRLTITGRRFLICFKPFDIFSTATKLSDLEKTPIKSCRSLIVSRSTLGRKNVCLSLALPCGVHTKRRNRPYTERPSLDEDDFFPGPWLNMFGCDSEWTICSDKSVLLLIHLLTFGQNLPTDGEADSLHGVSQAEHLQRPNPEGRATGVPEARSGGSPSLQVCENCAGTANRHGIFHVNKTGHVKKSSFLEGEAEIFSIRFIGTSNATMGHKKPDTLLMSRGYVQSHQLTLRVRVAELLRRPDIQLIRYIGGRLYGSNH